jgi:3'(2'), 5'-bisphosphate nucleotidase
LRTSSYDLDRTCDEPAVDDLIDRMCAATLAAARACAASRVRGDLGKRADRAANDAMMKVLSRTASPTIVSEEMAATHGLDLSRGDVMLLDPLDGTSMFDIGASNYATCAALLREGVPVAGVICCPGERTLVRANCLRRHAAEMELSVSLEPVGEWRALPAQSSVHREGIRALIGQSELVSATLDYLKALRVSTLQLMDSAQCFLSLARRDVDVIVKLGPSMDWDLAAGHAIVKALGGIMADREGRPVTYDKPHLRTHGFVAALDPDVLARLPAAGASAAESY